MEFLKAAIAEHAEAKQEGPSPQNQPDLNYLTMKVCAFCPQQAVVLTQEHLWSGWISRLFPGKEFTWSSVDPKTLQRSSGRATGINRKVEAVCDVCNNGWMSKLETAVKPILSRAIRDGDSMCFTRRDVAKLAAFLFKNAVIANYLNPSQEPFFTRANRERFGTSLRIPLGVDMWFAGLKTMTTNGVYFGYVLGPNVSGDDKLWHDLEVYVFTFAIGYLALQLRATRYATLWNRGRRFPLPLLQTELWDRFSVQFWPDPGSPVRWPPVDYLTEPSMARFVHRWSGPVKLRA